MSEVLRRTDSNDIAALKKLWAVSFGDTTEEINMFFDCVYGCCDAFAAELDGELIAALYAIPCELKSGEDTVAARYIYAVATMPEFRGRGIMTRLMDFAHAELESDGVEAFWLYPANEGLSGFYAKAGYESVPSMQSAEFEGYKTVSKAKPVDAADVEKWRGDLLAHKSAMLWDKRILDYALKFYDAEWLAMPSGIALASCKGDKVIIHELLSADVQDSVSAICAYYGVRLARVTLPAIEDCRADTVMIRTKKATKPIVYTNLFFN